MINPILEMIRCDEKHPVAWLFLAGIVSKSGEKSIQLLDGTTLSIKQVYLNALKYNPYHIDEMDEFACLELGDLLSIGETVQLSSTKTVTAIDLYLRVLDKKLGFESRAYCSLGIHSPEGFTFPNGQRMTQRQLFLEALKHDSKNAKAREHLQKTLRIAEFIDLPDGTVLRPLKEKIPEALKV